MVRVILVLALFFFASTNGDIGTEELKKELAALRLDVVKEFDTLRSEVQVLSKKVSILTNELEDKDIVINQPSEQVKVVTNQMEDNEIRATQQRSPAINQRHTITSLTENVKSFSTTKEETSQLPGDLLL